MTAISSMMPSAVSVAVEPFAAGPAFENYVSVHGTPLIVPHEAAIAPNERVWRGLLIRFVS